MNMAKLKPYLMQAKIWQIVLFGLPVVAMILMLLLENSGGSVKLANASYRPEMIQGRCQPDQLLGKAGASYGESTENGIHYNVRTPLNYDPSFAHPFLLVLSPAGSNRAKTENTTGLTLPATSKGFIVAYADHPELSPTTTVELGTIPRLVAQKWCIDKSQIFVTGHSDGGTSAMAVAFMQGTREVLSAIAPSAAGVTYRDLKEHECPEPLPVMIMHSRKDRLFPGYGLESAGWWAACNQCGPIPENLDNGCAAYSGCANNSKTWYCEGDKPHSEWPQRNRQIIDFFITSSQQ